MANEFTSDVKEVIECITEGKSSWGLFFAKISFNNTPAKLNLRNMNAETYRMGSGISLTDEQWDKVASSLIRMGFGDKDVIKQELEKRESRITTDEKFFDE